MEAILRLAGTIILLGGPFASIVFGLLMALLPSRAAPPAYDPDRRTAVSTTLDYRSPPGPGKRQPTTLVVLVWSVAMVPVLTVLLSVLALLRVPWIDTTRFAYAAGFMILPHVALGLGMGLGASFQALRANGSRSLGFAYFIFGVGVLAHYTLFWFTPMGNRVVP